MEERYLARSSMPVPARALFDWHARPGTFERRPPFDRVEILERSGGLAPGARTILEWKLGPLPGRWVAVHTAVDEGRSFIFARRSTCTGCSPTASGPSSRTTSGHALPRPVRPAIRPGTWPRRSSPTAMPTAADLGRHAEPPGPPLRVGHHRVARAHRQRASSHHGAVTPWFASAAASRRVRWAGSTRW